MCHDPVGHTDNQMLSPVPIASQNIQRMRDWVQTFGVAVCQMAKAGTLLSCLNQREIRLGEPVSFKLSHFEEQQKKKQTKKQTPAVTRNQMSHFQTMRLHVMIVTLSLEWETHFIHRRFFPRQKKCLLQQKNCVYSLAMEAMEAMGLLSPFLFMYLLTLLFVSLKLTCLYWYVYLWSKLKGRKSLSWQVYAIHAKLWKLQNEQYCWGEKRYIYVLWWAKSSMDQC